MSFGVSTVIVESRAIDFCKDSVALNGPHAEKNQNYDFIVCIGMFLSLSLDGMHQQCTQEMLVRAKIHIWSLFVIIASHVPRERSMLSIFLNV